MGKPENLALAGLLHDIGLADIPQDIQEKEECNRSPEEQEVYHKHVDYTLNLIKSRKLIVPEIVLKAIAQHHEQYNGKGYPKEVPASKICIEAQILAIADRFDYLTSLTRGKARMEPFQAIEYLQKQTEIDPENMDFDPKLIAKILKLFPKPEESKVPQAPPAKTGT